MYLQLSSILQNTKWELMHARSQLLPTPFHKFVRHMRKQLSEHHVPCTLCLCSISLQDAKWEFMRANNKIRFIRAVITGELQVSNRKRADIEADLEAQGFDRMAKSKDVSTGRGFQGGVGVFWWPCIRYRS